MTKLQQTPDNAVKSANILVVKTANKWMDEARNLPDDRQLYDEIWSEGETCFLFGGPGAGKSLFAVQIGVHIAKTEPVLYCDFELSPKQFRKRYRIKEGCEFKFPDNFYRAEFTKDIEFESNGLIQSIDSEAKTIGAKIILIDNISWIIENSEKGEFAGNFMKKLSQIKRNNGYSILTVAHTPKRDESNPINLTDMAGSMRLQNFIDSSFAIVQSFKEDGLRYLKQTKCRSEEKAYGFESVQVLRLEQQANGFTGFTNVGTAVETEHLKRPTEPERIDKKNDCLKYLAEGKPYREIITLTGLSLGAIAKYKKEQEDLLPF